MRFRIKRFQALIVVIALIIGIFAGTFGYNKVVANYFPNQSFAPAPNYPTNENGETYGSASLANSLDTEPDLISAIGVGGTHGYVRKTDLNGEMPKTPEQALAQMRRWEGKVRQIPLYDVDGKTVIGVFNVGGEKTEFMK